MIAGLFDDLDLNLLARLPVWPAEAKALHQAMTAWLPVAQAAVQDLIANPPEPGGSSPIVPALHLLDGVMAAQGQQLYNRLQTAQKQTLGADLQERYDHVRAALTALGGLANDQYYWEMPAIEERAWNHARGLLAWVEELRVPVDPPSRTTASPAPGTQPSAAPANKPPAESATAAAPALEAAEGDDISPGPADSELTASHVGAQSEWPEVNVCTGAVTYRGESMRLPRGKLPRLLQHIRQKEGAATRLVDIGVAAWNGKGSAKLGNVHEHFRRLRRALRDAGGVFEELAARIEVDEKTVKLLSRAELSEKENGVRSDV